MICQCGHQSLSHWADWDGIHSCDTPGCDCKSYSAAKVPIEGSAEERVAWDAGYIAGVKYARQAAARGFSAGDLYLAALDEWFTHCLGCNADPCDTCATVLNRARLARKVWESSAHRSVSSGAERADARAE